MILYSRSIGLLNRLSIFPSNWGRNLSTEVLGLTSLNLNNRELPKQPVPSLQNTADRYLRSVKPLLNKDEYCNTEKVVTNFIDNVAPKLQNELLKKYENTDNWMNDWFLHAAYLGYRSPVIVSSSPGTVGPPQKFNSLEEFYAFGAKLIRAVWDFNSTVKSGKIKQQMVRGEPLDMQPYAMILGTHRRPGRKSDQLIHTDDSRHIIILSNNHFFKLNIVDDNENLLSESEIKCAIRDVFDRSRKAGKAIGILTGIPRDQWSEDYHRLKEIGNNAEILRNIEDALFILCLDKELPRLDENKNLVSIRAVQSMTGYSSCTNSGNRWHDKTVQLIISPDGFVGMEYEHTPCEGGPVADLYDHILTSVKSESVNEESNLNNFPKAKHLKFELDEILEKSIDKSADFVDKLSMDMDMDCFTFDDFGTTAIKRAKQSPDSFIQIAMQVAIYKVEGKPVAHYESAGLRRFRNTRTECIRSTSIESVEFAKMMTLGAGSIREKKEVMTRAINTHKRIASEAAVGQGVDRHLFGLKMIAIGMNIELPELYKDVGYTRSTHFTLTSSQVAYKTASFMCYGPVVPNGYGCCYNPRSDDILFACSSFKSSRETCTKKFAGALQQALRDMMEIAES